MKLNDKGLVNKKKWEEKGYKLPQFDRDLVREKTLDAPVWLHFGAGNIFRAYVAALAQKLLDSGDMDTGIIIAEGYDYELLDVAYRPFDDLSISVTLKPDGNIIKTVLGSVTESVKTNSDEIGRVREIFASESLQLVSFTITEKAYSVANSPFIECITDLCLYRYKNCKIPLALVSMDNCSHNGLLLKGAIYKVAEGFVAKGIADEGFLDYLDDPARLAFPCTMIDKITPYPDKDVAKILFDDGVEDMTSRVTALDSVTAPFVNSEEPEYLVIEDIFPNGRPPLEKAGVMFSDLETVDKFEKMKVCTCLNPLHTAISMFACMLSYTRISDAMKDLDLFKLVGKVAEEGLPVVVDPGIISPKEFIETVINIRLPNPYIPDTPQRIATDTSKKLAVRFGETIKAYARSETLDVLSLEAIPLVLAGWCRYLLCIDDNGEKFTLDPDPMHAQLLPLLTGVTLGTDVDCAKILKPILERTDIFGADLYETGLAEKVIEYFKLMIAGKSAIRKILNSM